MDSVTLTKLKEINTIGINAAMIKKKLIERCELLEKDYDDPEVDNYTEQILKRLFENKQEFNGLFIMEVLTYLGYAPNLLYNDDGGWSCTLTGYSSIPNEDPEGSVNLSFGIPNKEWVSTPNEAILAMVENMQNERVLA